MCLLRPTRVNLRDLEVFIFEFHKEHRRGETCRLKLVCDHLDEVSSHCTFLVQAPRPRHLHGRRYSSLPPSMPLLTPEHPNR